jgi:predicted membrane channel-forming protein YqfA (hemolysin III family)
MQIITSLVNRLGIAGELLRFFWERKWWWLSPMILLLLCLAGLMIFAQSSAIAPFIYTLF